MSTATAGLPDAGRVVQDLEAAFVRNANAGNAAAVVEEFYAEDAQLLPPNSPIVKGKAAIRDFWTGIIAAGAGDVTLETLEVAASGDLIYNTGHYGFSLGGDRHIGKYVVVYRRQADGGFKAVVDSFSPNA
jgi:ketosteroid isomerase-like protein